MNREEAITLLRRHSPSFPRDPTHGPLVRIVDAVMEAANTGSAEEPVMASSNAALGQLPEDATPEMVASVASVLSPYSARLVWKQMYAVARLSTRAELSQGVTDVLAERQRAQLIRDGVSRDLSWLQIIAEAAARGMDPNALVREFRSLIAARDAEILAWLDKAETTPALPQKELKAQKDL